MLAPLEPTFLCWAQCQTRQRFCIGWKFSDVHVVRGQFLNMFETLVDDGHEVILEVVSGHA